MKKPLPLAIEKNLSVCNELGLHTRPATMLVKTLQSVKSTVFITYQGERGDAKSILNLLMLAIPGGAEVVVRVEGEDAAEVMQSIEGCFAIGFGEL